LQALSTIPTWTVYEIGEYDGQHFVAVGFLDGMTLKHRIAAPPPGLNTDPGASVISTVACLFLRRLIRVLFLLTENVEDLVDRIRRLLRVRVLALIGIRIPLPQQVP